MYSDTHLVPQIPQVRCPHFGNVRNQHQQRSEGDFRSSFVLKHFKRCLKGSDSKTTSLHSLQVASSALTTRLSSVYGHTIVTPLNHCVQEMF